MPSRFYQSTGMLHPRQVAPSTNVPYTRPDDNILLGPGGQIVTSHADGDAGDNVSAALDERLQTKLALPGESQTSDVFDIATSSISPSTISSFAPASTSAPTSVPVTVSSSATATPSAASVTSLVDSTVSISSSTSVPTTSSSDDSSTSQLSSSAKPSASPERDMYRGHAKDIGAILGVIVFLAICTFTSIFIMRRRSRRAQAAAKLAPDWDPARAGQHAGHGRSGSWEKFGSSSAEVNVRGLYDRPYPNGMFGTTGSICQPGPTLNSPVAHQYAQYPYGTPFPVVPVLHPRQSVPDLAPDFGRLKVTNYMPGDTGSTCDEASRANSRMGRTGPSEYGSPRPGMGSDRMRTLRSDGGMEGPWGTPRMRVNMDSERIDFAHVNQRSPLSRSAHDIPDLPHPATSGGSGIAQSPIQPEGWTSNVRTGLINAFNAVMHGTPPPRKDNLTQVPRRQSRRSVQSLHLENPFASPSNSMRHIEPQGDWEDPAAWMMNNRDGRAISLPAQPPMAVVHIRDRAPPSLSRASSYTNSSVVIAPTPSRGPSMLPEIPPFSPMSHTADNGDGVHSANVQAARGTRKTQRPPAARRATSALSVGSDMSRTSSTASLTEDEIFARMMLQERRKKMVAHSAGRSMS